MTSGYGDGSWPSAPTGDGGPGASAPGDADAEEPPAPPVTDPDEAEGRVYTVSGQDWDEIVAAAKDFRDQPGEEGIVVNMGP